MPGSFCRIPVKRARPINEERRGSRIIHGRAEWCMRSKYDGGVPHLEDSLRELFERGIRDVGAMPEYYPEGIDRSQDARNNLMDNLHEHDGTTDLLVRYGLHHQVRQGGQLEWTSERKEMLIIELEVRQPK